MVNREMHQQLPDLPLILFGHSMGSLAVPFFARDHDDCMDMLIVLVLPSKNGARSLGEAIAHMESAVFGPAHKSKVIETLSFAGNVMRFRKDKTVLPGSVPIGSSSGNTPILNFVALRFTDDGYLAPF